MPSRTGITGIDETELTPFARAIYNYMLSFRPTMNVHGLATQTGINDQTIWGWLYKGTIPRRSTILQLAQATGLSPDELLRAAGLPTLAETMAARSRSGRRVVRWVMDQVDAALANDPLGAWTEEERSAIHERLSVALNKQLLSGADILRELGLSNTTPQSDDSIHGAERRRHPTEPPPTANERVNG